MKNRPIHENLDTSFVNLSALVKYLRRRQFAGQVRIELSGYEADIYLSAENQLRVREYDHIAGRIAEGEEALQRILIRSREPGGIINVYQTVAEQPQSIAPALTQPAPAPVKPEGTPQKTVAENPVGVRPVIQSTAPNVVTPERRPDPIPRPNVQQAPLPSAPKSQATIAVAANGNGATPSVRIELPKPPEKPAPQKPALPNLPFEFSNHVEDRARSREFSLQEQNELCELVGEFLGVVDRSLAMAKLDFRSAFLKACNEIAIDYPFLKTIEYRRGSITAIDGRANPKLLVSGITETLRRILDKLGANPKFAEVHRYTTQQMLGAIHRRRDDFDKFNLAKPLHKILGV